MPSRSQTSKTSSKIDIGTVNGSVADTSVEVGGDVVGGRLAAGLGEPTLAEADEDPRKAAGTGRVVVMAELAGPTGEEDDDRHDQLGLDGVAERRDSSRASGSPTVSVTIRE